MKKMKLVSIFLLLTLLFSNSVLAAGKNAGMLKSQPISGKKNESTGKASSSLIQSRGIVLAGGSLTIYDEGKGVIGVQAITICYMPVDKIKMRIYLDCYDDNTESWYTVDTYNYDFYDGEDPEHPDLTYAIASFDVKGKHSGGLYRLKAMHIAYTEVETHTYNTQTGWLRIQ